MGDIIKSEFWDEYGNDITEIFKKEEEERLEKSRRWEWERYLGQFPDRNKRT